jgi:hypothetical protein
MPSNRRAPAVWLRAAAMVAGASSAAAIPICWALMLSNLEIIGNFMYPAGAPAQLLQLVAAGLLNLQAVNVAEYPLGELFAAMDAAAVPGGPLALIIPMIIPMADSWSPLVVWGGWFLFLSANPRFQHLDSGQREFAASAQPRLTSGTIYATI